MEQQRILKTVGLLALMIGSTSASSKNRFREELIHYPADTQFWVTDFFVRGCKVFVELCPSTYKNQPICAQNYNEQYKNFNNYCEMQYENCNTWKNWHVFKRERC